MSTTKRIHILVSALLVASSDASYRVYNGEPTTIEKYPYMVSVYYTVAFNCGGSILNETTVLTAAHCATAPVDTVVIKAGSTSQCEPDVVVKVKDQIVHPKYNTSNGQAGYDIAILILDSPLEFSKKIKPIKLPAPSKNRLPVGTVGTVTGWGTIDKNRTQFPAQLQKVEMPVVSLEECQKVYINRDDEPSRKLGESHFCVGYFGGSKNVGAGDSGGPFVVNGTAYGLLSFGSIGDPPVYTSVPVFRDFIKNVTGL